MTNFTHEWIAKREDLEQAATEGPWSVTHGPRELPRIWSDAPQFESAEFIAKCAFAGDVVDAQFIADTRTSLPAALAALKAVLEQEGPRATGNYSEFSDGYHYALDACRDAIEATLRRKS